MIGNCQRLHTRNADDREPALTERRGDGGNRVVEHDGKAGLVAADAARDPALAAFQPERGLLEAFALNEVDQLRIGSGRKLRAFLRK